MKTDKYINNTYLAIARLFLFAPFAPGTFASLLAIILAPVLFLPLSPREQTSLLALLFFLGSLVSTRAEQILQKKDPSEVVIDELLGQWLVLFLVYNFQPVLVNPYLVLFLAFLFFRIFDILKPFPIKNSEHWLPAGYGIMLDDLIAGIYAGILLNIVLYLIQRF